MVDFGKNILKKLFHTLQIDAQQIMALLLKDFTLQMRQWKSNLCQLLTPILCMFFILLLQVIVDYVVIPAIDVGDPIGKVVNSTTLDLLIAQQLSRSQNLSFPNTILYALEENVDVEKIRDYFLDNVNQIENYMEFEEIDNFQDVDEVLFDNLEEYVVSDYTVSSDDHISNMNDSFRYFGALKIKDFDESKLNYIVQFENFKADDEDDRPTLMQSQFCKRLDEINQGYCEFTMSLGMMDSIHSAFIRNNSMMDVKTYVSQQPYYKEPFELVINLADLMGSFFYPLILLLGLPGILYTLLLEKESTLKEMMKLMGLKERNYLFSTFIFKMFWFFISMILLIILGLILRHRIFFQTNWFVLIFTFIGVGFQVVSVGFFLSSFISSSFVATIIGYLFVLFVPIFGIFFIEYLMKPGEYHWKFLLLFPTFPVVDVVYHLCDGCLVYKCLSWDSFVSNYDFIISLCFLYGNAVIYFVIGIYLNQIVGQTWGVRKSPLFFLNPGFKLIKTGIIRTKNFVVMKIKERRGDVSPEVSIEEKKKGKEYESKYYDLTHEDDDVKNERNRILRNDIKKDEAGILIQGLVKIFGRRKKKNVAVKEVYFHVKKRECFSLLGPNGAGKTTLIRMLAGLFGQNSGDAYMNGYSIKNEMRSIRSSLGLTPQFTICWKDLTSREHLLFYSRLKGDSIFKVGSNVQRILEKVGLLEENVEKEKKEEGERDVFAFAKFLWDILQFLISFVFPKEKKSSKLSGGMKRRLGIAIGLCGNPEILLLDEPTTGMDVEDKRKIWDLILSEKKGRCVILTTHSMEEADSLADRISIMSHGRLICLGSSLHLKNKYGNGYTLSVKFDFEKKRKVVKFLKELLRPICDLSLIKQFGNLLTYQLLNRVEEGSSKKFYISEIFGEIESHKEEIGIVDFELNQTTLEDVFLNVVTKDEERIISEKQRKTKNVMFEKDFIENEEKEMVETIVEVEGENGEEKTGKELNEESGSKDIEEKVVEKELNEESGNEDIEENVVEKESNEESGNEDIEENVVEKESNEESGNEDNKEEGEEESNREEVRESSNTEEEKVHAIHSSGEEKEEEKDIEDDDDRVKFPTICEEMLASIRDGCLQTLFLLNKNCLLSIRGWKSICLMMCSPVFVVFMMFGVFILVSLDRSPWYVHPEVEGNIEYGTMENCESWGENDCFIFCYSTDGNVFAESVMDEIIFHYGLAENLDYLKFSKRSDLEAYVYRNPNVTQTVVSFDGSATDISGNNLTTYTLYFNGTEDLSNQVLEFKMIIDNFIYYKAKEIEGESVSKFSMNGESQYFPRIPDRRAKNAQQRIFGFTGPIFFSLSASILFIICLYKIVLEKERGLRKGLSMVGMKKISYILSWMITFIVYGVIMSCMSVLAGYIFVVDCFIYSNPVFMLILFFTFDFSLICFGFALSAVLKTTKGALVIGFIILSISFILNIYIASGTFSYMMFSLTGAYQLIPLFFEIFYPPFNFGKLMQDIINKSVKVYDVSENKFITNVGYWGFDDLFEKNSMRIFRSHVEVQASFYSFLFLLLNSVIFLFLFWYLDSVITDKQGILFFLKPKYYGLDKVFYSLFRKRMMNKYKKHATSQEFTEKMDKDVKDEYLRARDFEKTTAIRIIDLNKKFRRLFGLRKHTRAVRDISLTSTKSTVLGLLGPNGAGKSTTIHAICSMIKPSNGKIFINEMDHKIYGSIIRKNMGVTLQHNMLWDELTAGQHLKLFGQMKGMYDFFRCGKKNKLNIEISDRLFDVSLLDVKNDLSKTFSGGMKRRLSVAMGYVGMPKIVLLDEPTTGLDPFSKREVWNLVKEKSANCTMLLTTHSMEEADALSTKIAIMNKGKIICCGDSLSLKSKYGAGYVLKFSCFEEKEEVFLGFMEKNFPHAVLKVSNACNYHYNLLPEYTEELIKGIKAAEEDMESSGKCIRDFGLSNTTLEDVYMRVTRENNGDKKLTENGQVEIGENESDRDIHSSSSYQSSNTSDDDDSNDSNSSDDGQGDTDSD